LCFDYIAFQNINNNLCINENNATYSLNNNLISNLNIDCTQNMYQTAIFNNCTNTNNNSPLVDGNVSMIDIQAIIKAKIELMPWNEWIDKYY